jgi:hypothetical protein
MFVAIQGAISARVTAQQLLGTPGRAHIGYSQNRVRQFTHFLNTPRFYSNVVESSLFGNEPIEVWASGEGARVYQAGPTLGRAGVMACATGSTSSGYAAGVLTMPVIFRTTETFEFTAIVSLSTAPTGTEAFTAQVGLFTTPSNLAYQGIFFLADQYNANWKSITHNGATQGTVSTQAANNIFIALRVYYNPLSGNVNFSINGSPIGFQSLNLPDETPLYLGGTIIKTLGNSNRELYIDAMSSDIHTPHALGPYL